MTVAFKKMEALIATMSTREKAKLLYRVSKELGETFPGIEKTEGVCGGNACIIRTRIPVWTLVSFKKLGMTDKALLQAYPSLRQQDLGNAWAFYKANKKSIDKDISDNNEA